MVYSLRVSAKEFKRLRRNKGYSQSQLARILKVTVRTVSRWENGKRKVPHIAIMALASLRPQKGGKRK
jgi:transcriptional regulator with XRE-family HTH domain